MQSTPYIVYECVSWVNGKAPSGAFTQRHRDVIGTLQYCQVFIISTILTVVDFFFLIKFHIILKK